MNYYVPIILFDYIFYRIYSIYIVSPAPSMCEEYSQSESWKAIAYQAVFKAYGLLI